MNKNIFITGAASGIGKATAIFFAKKGWNVGLFDINEKGLVDVANEIGHNSCMYKKLDVTNLEEWTDAINAYSDYTNGTCDLFFNNAGIAAFTGRIEDIPIEEAHKIVEINLNGVINGIFKILPLLKKTNNSMIINTGSVGSFVPVPGAAVYSATSPVIVLVMIFLFGFPEKMELIDELVVLVLLLSSIRYMWRIILICRVYSILPKRAPENSSRRRLF